MRRVLATLGAIAVLAGLSSFFAPSLAGLATAHEFHVTLVGLLALLQGARITRNTWDAPVDRAETGAPELVEGIPTPGDEFDETLASASSVYRVDGRRTVKDRLERVAVNVLRRCRGCDADEARRRLRNGTWTDDAVAAALFSETRGKELSLLTRLRIRIGWRSMFEWRARRAIGEIQRIWRDER